jgi:hypothetical protein
MDNLAFDPHGVFRHDLTYTSILNMLERTFICLIHYNQKNSMLM